MSLFAAISVKEMSDPALAELASICQEMVKRLGEDHPHRADYEELRTRLEGEERSRAAILAERNRAATLIQSAIRGKLARDDYAEKQEEARLLEQRTKAALTIQTIFRGHQARKTFAEMKAQAADALRLEQERQTELQLIAKAEVLLSDKKVDPARVSKDQKLQVGRLLEAYNKADEAVPSRKKASRAALSTLSKADKELSGYLDQIIEAVTAEIIEEKRQAEAAVSVVEPADFSREGARVKCGPFYFPGAGRLNIGSKSYQFHPNRAMVHVKDELADNATLATAQAYLNSLLAACRSVIATKKDGKHAIAGTTDTGANVTWNIIYKIPGGPGFAGEIFHIDSGYQNSPWLPNTKRGKCRTCNKPRNRHDNSHPVT
jgi:hypothetical protein